MDFSVDNPNCLCVCIKQMKKAAICLSLCPAPQNVNTEWLYLVGKYFWKICFGADCFLLVSSVPNELHLIREELKSQTHMLLQIVTASE